MRSKLNVSSQLMPEAWGARDRQTTNRATPGTFARRRFAWGAGLRGLWGRASGAGGQSPRNCSARLRQALPDLRLGERAAQLDVPDDAVPVDEEGARQAQDAEAARRRAVRVEHRHEPVEPELIDEGADLVARLLEVDLDHRHVRLAAPHALEGGHLLAARHAPGRPEVHDHDPAAKIRQARRSPRAAPREIRSARADSTPGGGGLDLCGDDRDVPVAGARSRG